MRIVATPAPIVFKVIQFPAGIGARALLYHQIPIYL